MTEIEYSRGKIVEYTNHEEFCHSYILPPGFGLRNQLLLFFIYLLILCYFFIGIALISDVFMESIEVITSQTRTVITEMPDGTKVVKKSLIWNPTLANLTLMALGSSAPEIILNVYETCITLGSTPGELGASTIVGSAAFNFLVISGVSIYAVSPQNDERDLAEREEDGTPLGVKKINDLGVFSITCFSAVGAYLWIFWCLKDFEVQPSEAYITFGLFFVLIITATATDMINRFRVKK